MRNRERASRSIAEYWKNWRKRLRLECRECEIICERVVSPWHCLKSSCRYVYVFKDSETSYFGCLHKVFDPELDLAAFKSAPARGGSRADPYGFLRVARSPQPQCRVSIEQAYSSGGGHLSCCNPTFFQHPSSPRDDSIRMTARHLPERDDPQSED